MLDKIWTCCSSEIPKTLLPRQMKPHRKPCEVISNECSLLEKVEKNKRDFNNEVCSYTSQRKLRCIGKTEFCYSINWKTWISPWEKAEMTWKASEGTRFAGFAAVREEEWACLLGLAAYMHPHPHAAAPLPVLPFPVLQAKQENHSLLKDLRSLLSQASTNSARANGVQLSRCPHGRQVPTPRIGAWYHLLNA